MRRITKLFKTKATSIDENSKTATFVISDNSTDRYGEIVDQKSWNFKSYQDNPLLLWGHDPSEPENVLGTASSLSLSKDGTQTTAKLHFDTDINPKADLVFKQLTRGTLNAVSVGFINHSEEYEDNTPVLKDNELLEISVVPIPANPNAIALALKEGSLNHKDAKWMLDSMDKESEAIKKQLETDDESEHLTDGVEVSKQLSAVLEAVTSVAKGQAETNERLDTLVETTKGAIADVLTAGDPWDIEDAKWMRMQPIMELYWALSEVYFYAGTPLDEFQPLLKEFTTLVAAIADGKAVDGKGTVSAALADLDSKRIKEIAQLAFGAKAKATPSTDLPTAPDDAAWSGADAKKRVKEWATTDDAIDYKKYSKAFLWYDSSDGDGLPEKQGSYKLPFADVIDGELKAVLAGVEAAYGAVDGARGGVDIPDDDKSAVLSQIKKYYEKFGKELPEETKDLPIADTKTKDLDTDAATGDDDTTDDEPVDDPAKGGEDDQPGAGDESTDDDNKDDLDLDELDLDADLTDEVKKQIDAAV